MKPTAAGTVTELQALLGRRVRGARASFFLGLALFATAFGAYLYFQLAPLALPGTVTGFAGFVAGLYFLLWGLLWGALWSLVVHLNGLVSDLAAWIGGVLDLALAQLDAQFASGTVVDLDVVERQIGAIVATQTTNLGADSALAALANRYAPGAAKSGLRFLVVRVAGDVWRDEKLTIEALRSRAGRIAVEAALLTVRRVLWGALAVLLVLAALLIAAPFGLTALAARLITAFS